MQLNDGVVLDFLFVIRQHFCEVNQGLLLVGLVDCFHRIQILL